MQYRCSIGAMMYGRNPQVTPLQQFMNGKYYGARHFRKASSIQFTWMNHKPVQSILKFPSSRRYYKIWCLFHFPWKPRAEDEEGKGFGLSMDQWLRYVSKEVGTRIWLTRSFNEVTPKFQTPMYESVSMLTNGAL